MRDACAAASTGIVSAAISDVTAVTILSESDDLALFQPTRLTCVEYLEYLEYLEYRVGNGNQRGNLYYHSAHKKRTIVHQWLIFFTNSK